MPANRARHHRTHAAATSGTAAHRGAPRSPILGARGSARFPAQQLPASGRALERARRTPTRLPSLNRGPSHPIIRSRHRGPSRPAPNGRHTMSITERVETAHAWTQIPADEVSDAVVASMALGGVDHMFFMSGSEIAFYQEAIAKAHAHGRPAPRLITMTHEHAGLNAALGYAAVSGRPAATAVHVDAGTLHQGGAIHTAYRSGLPVLLI